MRRAGGVVVEEKIIDGMGLLPPPARKMRAGALVHGVVMGLLPLPPHRGFQDHEVGVLLGAGAAPA